MQSIGSRVVGKLDKEEEDTTANHANLKARYLVVFVRHVRHRRVRQIFSFLQRDTPSILLLNVQVPEGPLSSFAR